MTDNSKKVSQLPIANTAAGSDRVLILKDPSGSPSVRTVTVNTFANAVAQYVATFNNTAVSYTWTGTQSFTNSVVFSNSVTFVGGTMNSNGFSGIANNTLYVGTNPAGSLVNSSQLQTTVQNFVNTSQLMANLTAYQTKAGLASNVVTLTSNSANHIGNLPANAVVSNAMLIANLALYQPIDGLASNVYTLTANNVRYVGNVTAANVVSNAQLQANLAHYVTSVVVAGLANTIYVDNKAANAYANAVAYTNTAIADLINAAPSTLDTLKELADAIGDDPNFAVTVANLVATGYANSIDYADGVYSNATLYADNVGNTAYTNAVSYADIVANTAYSNAVAHADDVANSAYSNAVTYADGVANAAYTNAVSYVDNSGFVNTSQLSDNLALYVTNTNLSDNLANYVTTSVIGDYVNTSQLSDNLAVYVSHSELSNLAYDIVPSTDNTYSLGNSSYQWKDLHVSANTIYMGGVPITVDVANSTLLVNGQVITGGGANTGFITFDNNTISTSNYDTPVSLVTQTSVAFDVGDYEFKFSNNTVFYMPSGYINNENGNVTLGTGGAYVVLTNAASNIGMNQWTFNTDGSITFPDNSVQNTAFVGFGTISINQLANVNIDYETIEVGYVLKWNGADWSAGIDATTGGGGTDADTLDGQHGGYYLNYNNFTNTPNLAVYQTTAGLSAAVAGLSANYATYVLAAEGIISNSSGVHVNANNGLVVNTSGLFVDSSLFVNTGNLSANLSNYQTTAGLAANVAKLTANNTSFVGSVTAANVVSNAQLQANLSNYASLAGAAFTNNVSIANTLTVTRLTALGAIEESFVNYSNANAVFTFDCSNSTIFNVTTPAANFTPSLTNFTLANNNVTAVTFLINQGGTPYITTSNVQINSSTNTTITWQGGLVPSGTASKKDVITLSVFNVSGTYTVLGQLTSFG